MRNSHRQGTGRTSMELWLLSTRSVSHFIDSEVPCRLIMLSRKSGDRQRQSSWPRLRVRFTVLMSSITMEGSLGAGPLGGTDGAVRIYTELTRSMSTTDGLL